MRSRPGSRRGPPVALALLALALGVGSLTTRGTPPARVALRGGAALHGGGSSNNNHTRHAWRGGFGGAVEAPHAQPPPHRRLVTLEGSNRTAKVRHYSRRSLIPASDRAAASLESSKSAAAAALERSFSAHWARSRGVADILCGAAALTAALAARWARAGQWQPRAGDGGAAGPRPRRAGHTHRSTAVVRRI